MSSLFEDLPLEVADYIVRLRKEAQAMRRQRNGARAEADALRAELAELKAQLGV